MNIVHVSVTTLPVTHRYGGAIQRRVLEVAAEQARRGHQVFIYSPGSHAATDRQNGVTFRFIPCRSRLPARHLEFQLRVVRDLISSRIDADALYFHGQPEGAWLSAALGGRKYLWFDEFHFRRSAEFKLTRVYRSFLGKFDRLLAVSEYCRDESSRYRHIRAGQMSVVYNGVNLTQFCPNKSVRPPVLAAVDPQRPVVLYVGRVCRQKGSDLLFDAYARLKSLPGGVQLVVAGPIGQFGTAETGAEWSARIKELDATYLGAVEESHLSAVYNAATVFVMPTRMSEMFGMAAVEAQACGIPVVASDHGGLVETVPYSCGSRFEVGNSVDMADKVAAVLEDTAAHPQLVANCLHNATRFSWDAVCSTLESIHAQQGAPEK